MFDEEAEGEEGDEEGGDEEEEDEGEKLSEFEKLRLARQAMREGKVCVRVCVRICACAWVHVCIDVLHFFSLQVKNSGGNNTATDIQEVWKMCMCD